MDSPKIGRSVFSPSHIADLEASGLTRETWESAGLYTEIDSAKLSKILRWEYPAKNLGACLVFPYFDVDGKPLEYSRLKPCKPRVSKKGGETKPIKYEAPRKVRPHPYFPPGVRESIKNSGSLILTEGEKKALCACQNGYPTIGLSGVWSWKSQDEPLLPELAAIDWTDRIVHICFDSDRETNDKIRRAEAYLAAELKKRGANVRIVELKAGPDGEKTGIDDFFVRGGTASEFFEFLDRAIEPTDPHASRPKGRVGQPPIIVDVDEHRMNDQAIAALAGDTEVYSRGGLLVRVVNDEADIVRAVEFPAGPRIVPLSAATLRERLTAVALWYKPGADDTYKPTTPPKQSVQAILDRKQWPGIRRLVGLVEYPVMLADGTILDSPGYHRESGLMYMPRTATELTIPDKPTQQEAKQAVAMLEEVVSDFPFAEAHHRAAWVASVLTPLARYSYRGCSPFFMIDANVPAAGKGLLADVAALIIQGSSFAVTTLPEGGEEFRKRVTSILIRGSTLALFDNLAGDFGSAEIDALLTSQLWSDRVLGVSEVIDVPVLTTWFGTGNNVNVVGDTSRRVCPIRLESAEERPEERKDLIRTDLRGWTLQERPRLLSAALTILRGYHVASRPDQELPQWGSFENWSTIVRGAIVWAGMVDPWKGREGMRERAGDEKLQAIGGLMELWGEIDPSGDGLTCASIIRAIEPLPISHALHDVILTLAGSKPEGFREDRRSIKLGYQIRKTAGRTIAGRRFVQAGMSSGVKRWSVVPADKGQPGGDSGDSGDSSNYTRNRKDETSNSENGHRDMAETIPTIDTIPTSTKDCAYDRRQLGGIM